jgi:hypothetical protein
MTDPIDTLLYHSRRSVDELTIALNAKTPAVTLAHKHLSMLHFNRFVATMNSTVDAIQVAPSPQPETSGGNGYRPRLTAGPCG